MTKNQKALATESISKLLLKQSTPAMIGLLVMSLYNLVDAIFIGHSAGPLGIAGLAISFPIQMIIMALAQTIGIGISSIISRSLGAKNFQYAEEVLGNYFSLTIISSLIITMLSLIFTTPLLTLFGATDTILPYALSYMQIILIGTVFVFFASSGNNIIRAEGDAKFAMTVMLISAGLNIILDPIFIFTLDMGIQGAAIATVISQILSSFCVIYYFVKGRNSVRIHFKYLKIKWEIVKKTFAIGTSSFARHIASSLMIVVLNYSLSIYGGDIAIATYGILNRLFMLVLMPIFGVVQGMQPILGYNYGAKSYARAREIIVKSIKISTIISVLACFILIFFAKYIIRIFTNDNELISMSISATQIIVIMLPVVGFQVVTGGTYQSLGKAVPAFILSIARQIIFLIPMIIILPLFFGLTGLWYSFPISDFSAAILSFIMIKKEFRSLTKTSNF